MKPHRFIQHERILENYTASEEFLDPRHFELLPWFRLKFGRLIQDTICSVLLMEDGGVAVVNYEGMRQESHSNSHEPSFQNTVRYVYVELNELLPEQDAFVLRECALEVCPVRNPVNYLQARQRVSELLHFSMRSYAVAEALGIFYPEYLFLLRQNEEIFMENNAQELQLETYKKAAFTILEWAKHLAIPASAAIRDKLVNSVILNLKSSEAFGVHGDEFDCAWDEYAYAVINNSILGDVIDVEIDQLLWDVFSSLPSEDRRTLWLSSGDEADACVDARLFDRYHVEPDEGAFEVVFDSLRSEFKRQLFQFAEKKSLQIKTCK